MVLAGGPGGERAVSLRSGEQIASSLEAAGHEVLVRDVLPDDLSALDEAAGGVEVVFPALHGPWGEGGPLQRELEARGLAFVGSGSAAAELSMDKVRTKLLLGEAGLPTPAFQALGEGDVLELGLPVVLKPVCEGSSLGMAICGTMEEVEAARGSLHGAFGVLLAERFVRGRELTVGVLGGGVRGGAAPVEACPVLEIRSAGGFYDYAAKYERDDTEYCFDLGLSEVAYRRIQALAERTHALVGAAHLSRVDLLLGEDDGAPQILEINTLPGFTTHSLLPMAAREAGIETPELVRWLVELALKTPRLIKAP